MSDPYPLFHDYFPYLEEQDMQRLREISVPLNLPKKAPWNRYYSEGSRIGFLLEGALRGYFITESGGEQTVILRQAGQSIGTPNSLKGWQRRTYHYQALVASRLLEFQNERLWQTAAVNPRVNRLVTGNLFENIHTLLQRVENLIHLTPSERLADLLLRRPDILAVIPQKYVAQYLGMTPVSLSRLLAKRRDRKKS